MYKKVPISDFRFPISCPNLVPTLPTMQFPYQQFFIAIYLRYVALKCYPLGKDEEQTTEVW